MRTKFPNVLSKSLLITPSSLLSSIFLLNCVAQFKNSFYFSSSAHLLCDFPFCYFSRPVIFGFCFDISFFTLSTIGASFSTDSVCTGSSEGLVRFKKETSFKSGIGKISSASRLNPDFVRHLLHEKHTPSPRRFLVQG